VRLVPQVDRRDRPRAAVGVGSSAVSRLVGGAQPRHGVAMAAQIRGHVLGMRCHMHICRCSKLLAAKLARGWISGTLAMGNAECSSGHELEHAQDTNSRSGHRFMGANPDPNREWPQISLMDPDDPPDNSIPNPVDTGPALGDDEVCSASRERFILTSSSPPDASRSRLERGRRVARPIVRVLQGVTTSGFKEEPLPDDGDDEAPQEDHVVQLRCVLEIMNTGARGCSPAF